MITRSSILKESTKPFNSKEFLKLAHEVKQIASQNEQRPNS
jgi:hypothetical protein